MAKKTGQAEKRRHRRVRVSKPVQAKTDSRQIEGSVTDISAGGAALNVDAEVDGESQVELDIEDMSPLSGTVARSYDDGFAVEFDLDEEEEDRLLTELTELHDTINLEDL
ncbi:MAG: PilZ domain-containing protein [Rhodospirillales bacterium]|jgi:c-di-GMP-binding flagellar brake protein YcgR|nr:PilZ domain-containing protein [Rhodospirillales bacterium]MDP6883264.1 PilZ domain-containing protein [Rhodospirillales bacterium]